MSRSEVIAGLTARFCQAHGREPDTDELIMTLADTVLECGKHISVGYMQWHPGRPVMPARPQRPAITDDEPETATE